MLAALTVLSHKAPRMAALSPPVQNRPLGIALRLGAVACFGFMAAAIKLGHEAGANTVELVFYRFFFGLPPLLVWIAMSRNWAAWRTERPLAHLLRSTVGLVTMALAFTALAFLPLAEATTIGFVAPLFAVALSALILKEPVGRHRWTAVAIGFVGVLVVMRPGVGALPAIGLAVALASALGVAAVTVTIRQISRTEGTQTIVLWFTAFSILIVGAAMPSYAQWHDARGWAILVALGLFGGTAQLLLTASLRFAPISTIAPFDYTQLLWAVLLGWAIWDVHAPAATWAGAALIIGGGLYTLYRERRLGREKPRAEPL